MEPKSPSKVKLSVIRNKRFSKVLIASSVAILLLLAGVYFAFTWKNAHVLVNRDYYTVVVDCGSTGTRVNVYKFRKSSSGYLHLPILEDSYPNYSNEGQYSKDNCKYHCFQTEPGLDKFVGNATGVRLSLKPLILRAKKWVPPERHEDTPIFVLATAGLRRLIAEDAKKVLDDVEHVLEEHSFLYRRNWIRVLSGREEAYYGWVALNYKMGVLGNSSKRGTLGLLDLGGSSLQVVFEVNGGRRDNMHLMRTKIGSVERSILAFSLPSFGLNEAFDRTVAMLSQLPPAEDSSGDGFSVRHPCLGSDFVQKYTCYACDRQNITYQMNLRGKMHKLESVHLAGDPNWEQCEAIARATATNSSSSVMLKPNQGKYCQKTMPSYGGRNILNLTTDTLPTQRFHALSGFFAVYSKLNLPPEANFRKIYEEGEQLCSNSWETNLINVSRNQKFDGQYCFRVPYMASLIEDVLCLGNTEMIFGPADISWTLGAGLIEGEYQWLITSKTSILSIEGLQVLYSPIFVFVLLMCLLFIVYFCQIKLPMLGRKIPNVRTPSLPSYVSQKHRPY